MSDTYNFQDDLKNSIFNADPKLDRKELLIDIFKTYVAKLFERTVTKGKIPFDSLVQVKKNLINEFRQTDLSEYQKSVEQYEKMFDETVQEILAFAATRHHGQDAIQQAPQELVINPDAYMNEGGLYLPKGLSKN